MGITKWKGGYPLPFYWRVLRFMDYLYFKRKNGSVFGKTPTISKKQVDVYLKDGCVRCDKDGKEIEKPKKTKKAKRK